MAKKEPVGMSALTPPSGENPIGEAYRHNPPSGKSSCAEESCSHLWVGEIPSTGRVDRWM